MSSKSIGKAVVAALFVVLLVLAAAPAAALAAPVAQGAEPTFQESASAFLQALLLLVISAAVPVLTGYVISWLKAKEAELAQAVGEQRMAMIRQAVRDAVLAAEQTGFAKQLQKAGEQKREWALASAKRFLEGQGIFVDPQLLYDQIEAIVAEELNSAKLSISG